MALPLGPLATPTGSAYVICLSGILGRDNTFIGLSETGIVSALSVRIEHPFPIFLQWSFPLLDTFLSVFQLYITKDLPNIFGRCITIFNDIFPETGLESTIKKIS